MDTSDHRGMTLDVYRSASHTGDTTLGGITSRATQVTVIGILDHGTPMTLPTYFPLRAATPTAPAVILVIRTIFGRVSLHLEPTGDSVVHYMHGGNYAGSTDSRWTTLIKNFGGLLPVHDRNEGR